MKSTILLIISLLISIISSTQQSSAAVDEPICLRRGQITSGTMLSPIDIENSKSPELLESGECSENAILLKPGVLVDGKMVPSGGYCLANGILLAGMAQSIGGTIEIGGTLPSGKSCSIKAGFGIGVSLSKGVILETLPENTPANQVFANRDKPLLNNLIYTTQIISDTMCLDGGVIVDGLIIKKNSATTDKDCPPGTARIHVGVVDSKQNDNDTHSSVFTSPNECLVDGVVGFGRVLVSGSLVKLGEALSSGKTCSLEGFDPFSASGVVLRNGVVAILPDKTIKETKIAEKDDDKADMEPESAKPELESDIDSKEVKNSIADVVEVAQKEAEKPISKKVKPRKGNCKKRKDKARNKADGLKKDITN